MAPLPFGTSKNPYVMNTNAITTGQKKKISDLLKQKGVTKKDLQKLLETGLLAKLLENIGNVNEPQVVKRLPIHLELLMKAAMFDSIPDEWELTKMFGIHPESLSTLEDFVVDYSKSFAQLMDESRFSRVDNDITEERFPIKGEGVHRLKGFLVPLKNNQTVARALNGIDARGLRPGNTAELLSLPVQLKALMDKRHVNLFHCTGISVTALGTRDQVGTPNGNRKVLRWGYNWNEGDRKHSSLSSDGHPYLNEYSGHYLLAFRK